MKHCTVKFNGKQKHFIWNDGIVHQVYKPTKKEIAEFDDYDWRYAINYNGTIYCECSEGVGLMAENWNNKAVRDEYLTEWLFELEEEMEYLMAEFL